MPVSNSQGKHAEAEAESRDLLRTTHLTQLEVLVEARVYLEQTAA